MRKIPAFTPDRALLDYLKENNYAKQKVTQGYLKLIVLLSNTQTIAFSVMDDDTTSPKVVGEMRLKRSDAFWASQFGFTIGKSATVAAVDSLQDETFENPFVFTNAAEAAALRSLYNGSLKIKISDELYFQQLDMKRFRYVGDSITGVAVSTVATVGILPASTFNPMTGFHECVPNILFSGVSTPEIQITLPVARDMSGTGGTFNYACLYFRGFYIPDGAKLGGQ